MGEHMNKQLNSYVDFDASADVVSIALNGLLKLDGSLTDVRSDYTIDVKNEIAKKNDSEVKLLYSYFFRYVESMHINLTELNYRQTRMNFTIEKKSSKGAVIGMFILDAILALCFGIGFSFIEAGIPQFLLFFLVFIITFIIFACLPFCAYAAYSDKNNLMRFSKQVLPRINKYVEIVKKKLNK